MPPASPPLSLALIRQRYTPFGGAERFLDRAMGALQADDSSGPHLRLTLLARHWEGETRDLDTITCNPPSLGRLWRDAGFAWCVRRTLQRTPFDLVQSHERIAGCDLYRAGDGVHRVWLQQRNRTIGPLRRLATTLSPYHRYVLWAERRLFHSRRLRAVICNSQMVREEIQRTFAIDENKLHVIYSGVDTVHFHPSLKARFRQQVRQRWHVPQDALLMLFVGSGFQRKGVPILLEAMAHLPEWIWLMVVGEDRRRAAMQRPLRHTGLDTRVIWTGAQKETAPLYGAADLLVLPTLYDPFPNVALEGMASGLPLITTHQCGASDLVEHGVQGLLGDALDRPRLVENILGLQDTRRRHAMGWAARARVEPLTLDAMSQKLRHLYHGLLSGPRPRPGLPVPAL